MVAIPTATGSGPPPGDADASAPVAPTADAGAAITPDGPPALIKPIVGAELLPILARQVVPADTVELELWVAADGGVSKAVLWRPRLDADREKSILDAARKLTFDANARGQRSRVLFSQSEVAGASPDATVASTPVPTHMKERVPRPEMAPRPPPPRPEMAPRPNPKPDK